jgi:hypothetical protein
MLWTRVQDVVINREQNTVTAQVNKFGSYAIMGLATDPVIGNIVTYPNPASSYVRFMIEIKAKAYIKIDFYTITGRLINTIERAVNSNILEGSSENVEIYYMGDDQLPNGTYLYKVSTENAGRKYSKFGKIVRMR